MGTFIYGAAVNSRLETVSANTLFISVFVFNCCITVLRIVSCSHFSGLQVLAVLLMGAADEMGEI